MVTPVACTASNLYVIVSAAPGGAVTRTFALRTSNSFAAAGTDTALTCTITGAATSCTSTNTVALSAGTLVDFRTSVTIGAAAAANAAIGWTCQ
ncbi:MAG TPA: hypothetical protein VN260_05505 [Dissulfurispiraceae bacterium]|nr:hypothetical protein [Dissulfurispiraceae bacterium]